MTQRTMAWLLAVAFAFAPASASTNQPQFSDLGGMFFTGRQAIAPPQIAPERSCVDMYREVTELIPRTQPYAQDFYSDPRNEAIGVAGLILRPAFALWGYTAVSRYVDRQRTEVVKERIAALRGAMADKQCFVR